MSFFGELGLYFGIMCIVVGALLLWTAWKKRSFEKAKEYYAKKPEYKDWIPLLWLVPLVAGFIWFSTELAQADELDLSFFDETRFSMGLEVPLSPSEQSIICVNEGPDDRLTSNLSIQQHLVGLTPNLGIYGQYTHHSCAVNKDAYVYDYYGVQLQWTIPWSR